MYTFAPTSQPRRSAQTVLWQITETLARLVAPILSFTADEVWDYLPAVEGREASVHLAQFPKPQEVFSEDPTKLLEEWKTLFQVRDAVMKGLEEMRQDKKIGKGIEADVYLIASSDLFDRLDVYDRLRSYSDSLKELLNVSAVSLLPASPRQLPIHYHVFDRPDLGFSIAVKPASGHTCARCWNFLPVVSNYGIWQNVCTRCHSALKEMGIAPPEAPIE